MALADQGRARPRPPLGPEPVTEFMGDHDRLARTLHQMLIKERDEHAAGIVKGGPKDFPEYRNRVGVIEGLDIAIALCEQAQRQL
jgi:hypothetical protein